MQSPAVTSRWRMTIHVGVDPQKTKAAVKRARYAAPGATGTAVITAKHAGKPSFAARISHRGSQLAAQPAHRQLLAPLPFRGLQHWAGAHRYAAGREPGREQRCEDRRRLGAAGMRAAQAPRRADHFNLSLHGYIRIRGP